MHYASLAPNKSRPSYIHEFFTKVPQLGACLALEVIHSPRRVRIEGLSKPTDPTLELLSFSRRTLGGGDTRAYSVPRELQRFNI